MWVYLEYGLKYFLFSAEAKCGLGGPFSLPDIFHDADYTHMVSVPLDLSRSFPGILRMMESLVSLASNYLDFCSVPLLLLYNIKFVQRFLFYFYYF